MKQTSQSKPLPKRKRIRLAPDAYGKPGVWCFVTVCCKKKEPLFAESKVKSLVVDILRSTARHDRVEVAAYTVLPNHLHFIRSAGPQGLITFVRPFKGRVAAELRNRFGQASPWQRSFFDHKLRSEESLKEKCLCVWRNPVRRGLVKRFEKYPWSGSLMTA
jgi:putative transposase